MPLGTSTWMNYYSMGHQLLIYTSANLLGENTNTINTIYLDASREVGLQVNTDKTDASS
jgi:hypothetical protein